MSDILHTLRRAAGGLLPGTRAARRLRRLEARVDRLAHLGLGSTATYMGNNRVLVRVIAGVHAFVFYVHADDKLLSPWLIASGIYEPELTDHLVGALRPDSHCIDVGANFGYFTCLMSKYCPAGRVVGLEPDPAVAALAADNLLVNALYERGEVLNAAAGDRAGELTLYRRVGRSGNTSIAACGEAATDQMREPPEQPFQVAMTRIDDLLPRLSGRVDHMKVDVEGAEPLVLAGARETIAANPQLQIVMEWSPGQLRHAGFDVAAFVRDIAAAGLHPSVIAADPPRAISHDELAGLPYQPGVLLRRPAG